MPAGSQHLLDMVQQWLEWAHDQLKENLSKCCSMAIQASSEKRVDPDLTVGG